VTDPVRDAMRVVYADGFRAGVDHALRRRARRALVVFSGGLVVGALLAVLGIGAAVAQPIPVQANDHRRDLTRLSRSVWGMDAPISTLAAQIHQESGWRAGAVSRVGAQGLSQFMPATAAGLARDFGDRPNPFDPRWSMLYQNRYMKQLYGRVEHAIDHCERFAFALSAYNGGMRWVQRRQSMSKLPQFCLFQTCDINPGITAANQKENSDYPKKIIFRLTPIYHAAGWGPGVCLL